MKITIVSYETKSASKNNITDAGKLLWIKGRTVCVISYQEKEQTRVKRVERPVYVFGK